MPCPERNGEVTDYEEVWRVVPPIPDLRGAWILESTLVDVEKGDGRKTFLGRIGGGYMALSEKKGTRFGVRSEIWNMYAKRWSTKYEIGDVKELPSLVGTKGEGFEGEEMWKEGDRVVVMGTEYIVRAIDELPETKPEVLVDEV